MTGVDVWYVRPEEPFGAAIIADAPRILSAAERERARRFAFDRDRDTYTAAHAMLRLALSRRARECRAIIAPARWRFRTDANGRPEVCGPEARLGLRFSLSHTTGLAVCAVAIGEPVGIDAEAVDRRVPLLLADHCLAPAERAALAALPASARPARFLEYWTLKEAFLKAVGVGLAGPLDRICFSVAPGQPVRVAAPHDLGGPPESWRLESWMVRGRHVIALAAPEISSCDRQARLPAGQR
jgi:4'-phosphopantetheinyl transferase